MNVLTFIEPGGRGDAALQVTSSVAGHLARRVVLLAVESDIAIDPGLLERAARRIAASGAAVETKVRPGRPRRAIVAEASERTYQITIFPPAGRGTLSRLVSGSRVRAVLRSIPSSVLVARHPSGRIRKILAAVKAAPFGETTIDAALEIGRALGAEVHAVHVAARDLLAVGAGSTAGAHAGGPPAGLEWMDGEFRASGREPEIVVRQGDVVSEVIREARSGAFDLLVVGHHFMPGQAGRQDVAERIILRSPIPVLAVQPRRGGL